MAHPRIERSHRISHDIRTPLTVIKEYASILRDELVGDLNPRQRKMLDVIDDRADEIHQLIENFLLLDASSERLTRADHRPFDLQPLLRRVAQPFENRAERGGFQLSIEAETDALVFADESLIELLLRNVLSQAVRQRVAGEQITLEAFVDQDFVVLETTAKVDSDALGELAICQFGVSGESAERLVEANFGAISVSPVENEDAVQIVVQLPRWKHDVVLSRYHASLAALDSDMRPASWSLIGFQLCDAGVATQFAGLLRFSVDAGELVLPPVDDELWLVASPNTDDRPSYLTRIAEAAEDVGLKFEFESARRAIDIDAEFDSRSEREALAAQLIGVLA